jgi:C-terminal processing protease CtpA/Prc
VQLTGSFTYTNEIINKRFTEVAVGLLDFHGFVIRDREWEVPVRGQVLGYLNLNKAEKRGDYFLALPIAPGGTPNDVDNNGKRDAGVQIFVLRFFPNFAGGPFAEGDDVYKGWPTFLTSIVASDADNEVLGGKLVVWSPDDKQKFPSGFGKDNKLFTKDDAVMALPSGWSVIDMDAKPFAVIRTATVDVDLREPTQIGVKDYSEQRFTEAFKNLLDEARREYAFNGIEGKEPDWDALESKLMPQVEKAEQEGDRVAFFNAVRAFTLAFKDGHVSLNSDDDAVSAAYIRQYVGSLGLVLRELDDGRVIVIHTIPGSIGAKAGVLPGAEITQVDGVPVGEAIGGVQALSAPFSSETSARVEQLKYLLRRSINTQISLTYKNPGKAIKTSNLKTVFEVESLFFDDNGGGAETNRDPLPIEFKVLSSGIGYIKINSNNDDLNLSFQLFRRALTVFEAREVSDVIIDLRNNGGGTGLGLSEYFIKQPIIEEITSTYYSADEGKFVNGKDVTSTLKPKAEPFKVDKLAVLVSPSCASACEVEAYELSLVPGAMVVGYYPSAGIFADVARGQYKLPADISLQFSKIRFTLPDGSLFLEGTGVQPTVRVPMSFDNAMNWKEDVVLNAAEEAIKE